MKEHPQYQSDEFSRIFEEVNDILGYKLETKPPRVAILEKSQYKLDQFLVDKVGHGPGFWNHRYTNVVGGCLVSSIPFVVIGGILYGLSQL